MSYLAPKEKQPPQIFQYVPGCQLLSLPHDSPTFRSTWFSHGETWLWRQLPFQINPSQKTGARECEEKIGHRLDLTRFLDPYEHHPQSCNLLTSSSAGEMQHQPRRWDQSLLEILLFHLVTAKPWSHLKALSWAVQGYLQHPGSFRVLLRWKSNAKMAFFILTQSFIPTGK